MVPKEQTQGRDGTHAPILLSVAERTRWGKGSLFSKWCWEIRYPHAGRGQASVCHQAPRTSTHSTGDTSMHSTGDTSVHFTGDTSVNSDTSHCFDRRMVTRTCGAAEASFRMTC